MSGKSSNPLPITPRQKKLLTCFISKRDASQHLVKRVTIILRGSEGQSNYSTYRKIGLRVQAVKQWRERWLSAYEQLCIYEASIAFGTLSDKELLSKLLEVLQDRPRSGKPPRISASQKAQIVALACQSPSDHGLPLSRWSHQSLAKQAQKLGIVPHICASYVGKLLKNTPTSTA